MERTKLKCPAKRRTRGERVSFHFIVNVTPWQFTSIKKKWIFHSIKIKKTSLTTVNSFWGKLLLIHLATRRSVVWSLPPPKLIDGFLARCWILIYSGGSNGVWWGVNIRIRMHRQKHLYTWMSVNEVCSVKCFKCLGWVEKDYIPVHLPLLLIQDPVSTAGREQFCSTSENTAVNQKHTDWTNTLWIPYPISFIAAHDKRTHSYKSLCSLADWGVTWVKSTCIIMGRQANAAKQTWKKETSPAAMDHLYSA